MNKLYLEDLRPGQRFRAGPFMVDAEEIKSFARTYDPQFFHVDEEEARRSIFGGLVASGWQTAAMSMRFAFDGGAAFPDGVIGAGAEIQWLLPVRPGDRLTVESEVLEVTPSRSRPDRGVVKMRTTTTNQKGETVQIIVSTAIVFARRGEN